MSHWARQSVFYHIYPLGLTGAARQNDFSASPVTRLDQLEPWLDHLQWLGINALYLGPLFESTSHGYDTADYYHVDRRLGGDDALRRFSRSLHERGMRLVLDGVLNHVGRDFWAFRDVQQRRENSPYRDWFANLRFEGQSPYGDPFQYEGWSGHYSLVKLNQRHPAVQEHLFGAVRQWMEAYQINGLRLDAADCLDLDFIGALVSFCKQQDPEFWLMGEVVLGDYRRWLGAGLLHSVTNYEIYKGLFSSFVDVNFFEIAYALNRQSGAEGIYRPWDLYTFADNHDVNRVASQLTNPAHLYPLYLLLMTMPGVPSIYYGSEWGLTGKKTPTSDAPLRPHLELAAVQHSAPQPDLPAVLRRLIALRRGSPALWGGSYRPMAVDHRQLVFGREMDGEQVLVMINAAPEAASLEFDLPADWQGDWVEILNDKAQLGLSGRRVKLTAPGCWGRVLRRGVSC